MNNRLKESSDNQQYSDSYRDECADGSNPLPVVTFAAIIVWTGFVFWVGFLFGAMH